MLIKLLLTPIWVVVDFLLSFLPAPVLETTINSSIFGLLGNGIAVIGVGNFIMLMGSVMFWYTVQFTWAIIEWIYRKIPGVN